MESAARKIKPRAVFQEFGEVVGRTGELFTVRGALSDVRVKRAASCLVEPDIGDRVLLAVEDEGDAFILAVLDRRENKGTTVSVEGDLSLRSTSGRVSVAGQEGVDVVSPTRVRITTTAMEVSAIGAEIAVDTLRLLGKAVRAELGKVKLLAETFDSVLERVSQRAQRSYRTVEELDQVRARHIDYAASGNAQIRGENTLVTAEDLVKLNAEQVHIG